MLCVTFSPEKAPILGVKVLLKKAPMLRVKSHKKAPMLSIIFLAKKALHVMLINFHPKGPPPLSVKFLLKKGPHVMRSIFLEFSNILNSPIVAKLC